MKKDLALDIMATETFKKYRHRRDAVKGQEITDTSTRCSDEAEFAELANYPN